MRNYSWWQKKNLPVLSVVRFIALRRSRAQRTLNAEYDRGWYAAFREVPHDHL